MIVLADTGVLIRLFETRDPLHGDVRRKVESLRSGGFELATTPQNIAEFWNVCTRPASARQGLGLSVGQAELRLRDVEERITIVAEPPATYETWRSLVVGFKVRGRQVHDARIAAVMLASGISFIFTLNPGDFERYHGITLLGLD